MATIEKSIDVEVPVRAAYNQWTQFEEFPRFMEGVLEVRQLGDRQLHWRAKIAGQEKTWDAEITEQIPDDRIAWRARSGAANAGVVTLHRITDGRTRIMLQLEYEPEGMVEKAGRRGRHREPPGRGRLAALQGVHRTARARDWCLARRDPAGAQVGLSGRGSPEH